MDEEARNDAMEAGGALPRHIQAIDNQIASLAAARRSAVASMQYDKAQQLLSQMDELAAKRDAALTAHEQGIDRRLPDAEAEARTRRPGLLERLTAAVRRRTTGDASEYSFVRGVESTQRVLGFERMFPDGVAMVGAGRYSMAVAFEDANYQSAVREEQYDILGMWGELLNSLDDGVSAQIWLQSRQIGTRELGEELRMELVNGDPVGNTYRREINALVEEKLGANDRSMRKLREIVLTVEAPTHEKAVRRLATYADTTHRFFANLDVDCHVMTGQERLDAINSMTNQDDPAGMATFDDLDCSPGLQARDLVAPSRIVRVGLEELLVGRRHVRSYVITKYASTTRDDLLSSLTQLPCDVTVSMHVRAWDYLKASQYVNRHLADVRAQNNAYKRVNTRPEAGRFVDDDNLPEALKDAYERAVEIRDAVDNQDQSMFDLTMVVTVMGRDAEELKSACAEVETVLQAQRLRADSMPEWREASLTASLPVGANPLPYTRTVFTVPLAAYVPFTSVEVLDHGGMYLGVNKDTRNFILYDREKDEDANGFVFGQPGGGKSFEAKWMITQIRLQHPYDKIIVIDPEREYARLAADLDGQVVEIGEGSQDHVNVFEMDELYAAGDESDRTANPLALKVGMVQAVLKMMARDLTDEQLNAADDVCVRIYERYLETYRAEDLPTLQDFYECALVVGESYPPAAELAGKIKSFVTGTANAFNNPTDVDLSKNLVVFDIQGLGQRLKDVGMVVILDYVWNCVIKNRLEGRRTWLFIDEFHLLLGDSKSENDYAVDFLDSVWTRSRKWGLYCTGITQNISRLLDIDKTRYMVENSHVTIITKDPVGAKTLAETLHLSDAHERAIRTLPKGEGLIKIGRKVIHYDNLIPQETCPRLYRTLTTKMKDLNAYRASETGTER